MRLLSHKDNSKCKSKGNGGVLELLKLTEKVDSLTIDTWIGYNGSKCNNNQADTYKEYLSASSNSIIAA